MRIQYQGIVEARPTYMHVGYMVAYPKPSRVYSYPGAPGAIVHVSAAVALAGIVLFLRLLRVRGTKRAHASLPALLLAACLTGAGAIGALCAMRLPKAALSPGFATTLCRMERLGAQTDAFAREHRWLPTPEQWQQTFGETRDATDGWFFPFRYGLLQAPGFDGQYYRITSGGAWEVVSDWLGRDGVAGTADDHPRLQKILAGAGLKQLQHGRQPRGGRQP